MARFTVSRSILSVTASIRLNGIGSAEEARRLTGGQPIYAIDVKDQIDGLTYAEILELAERSDVEVGVLN